MLSPEADSRASLIIRHCDVALSRTGHSALDIGETDDQDTEGIKAIEGSQLGKRRPDPSWVRGLAGHGKIDWDF